LQTTFLNVKKLPTLQGSFQLTNSHKRFRPYASGRKELADPLAQVLVFQRRTANPKQQSEASQG